MLKVTRVVPKIELLGQIYEEREEEAYLNPDGILYVTPSSHEGLINVSTLNWAGGFLIRENIESFVERLEAAKRG